MTRTEFINEVTAAIENYLRSSLSFDVNTQLRVDPITKKTHIVAGSEDMHARGFADQEIENAVSVKGAAHKTTTFASTAVSANFYPIVTLVTRREGEKPVVDNAAIERVAQHYFA